MEGRDLALAFDAREWKPEKLEHLRGAVPTLQAPVNYDEQAYKAPEEIRKANLCGADLRGANLDGVDFYLVDLRGARYDPSQAKQLLHCGAILEARV